MSDAQQLADAFCEILATTLGPADMADLRANHVRTTSYCPSHDYTDANMVMMAAWMKTFNTLDDLGGCDDLFNRAWDLARDSNFTCSDQTL